QYADEFLASYMCRTINSTGTGYLMRSKDYNALNGINTSFPNLMFADLTLWLDLTLISYKTTSFAIAFKYRIHNSVSKLTNGDIYQKSFELFLNFLIGHSADNQIRAVIERY